MLGSQLNPMRAAVAMAARSLSPRQRLTNLLRDGNTLGNYQRGIGLTVNGNGNVTAWANQIGSFPTLAGSGFLGGPHKNADGSVNFNTVDGAGTQRLATGAIAAYAPPVTVYLVINNIIWTNGVTTLFDGAATNDMRAFADTASPQIAIICASGAQVANNANITLNALHAASFVFNGAGSSITVDSTAATTGNPGTFVSTAAFTLGDAGGGGGVLKGDIHEAIVRNVADSAVVQANIRLMLKELYGTP